MAEIDEVLWQETKENLMSEVNDYDTVQEVLYDMKSAGFFDIEEDR